MLRFLLFSIFLFSSLAHAYPELVRAGYGNCISCHTSPSGGGLLNEYGRKLSADVMSAWSDEGEEPFMYGAFGKTGPSVNLGGDFRALQLYQSRSTRSTAQFVFMQADLEAGVDTGKFTFVGTLGIDYAVEPISRRHYIEYHATDEVSIRAGKFFPAVGINTENHSVAIKRGLGRDQATETYNLEAAWIAAGFDCFATAIFGRPDHLNLGAETGGALSGSVFFADRYKVGLSYYYGTRDVESRHVIGPFAILGFTKRFFLMVDTGLQLLHPSGLTGETGFVDTARLDYEITQGLHVYVLQEFAKTNLSDVNSTFNGWGLGVQFFPRPHLELNALWEKQAYGITPNADYAYLVLHFYP